MIIGYTAGVYDLFHIGHLNLLKNAKGMCDKLIVGVTTDDLVLYKGKKSLIPFDERIEIVEYCIAHNRNYAETAEKFQISYQQARNYTIKYEQHGIEGLRDGRGRRKSVEEMTEVEKLRTEVKLLRAEKERAEMEVSFLKKLAEIESRLD